jgi:uncharacterized membrane protein YjgN (DUF898 family)
MSCFLVLNSFVGNDHEAAAKKLALMFRMAPQEADAILEKVTQGQGWSTPREVSDQQAAVAENYLKGIGFQVERSGQQAVVDQIAGSVAVAEEPFLEEMETDTGLAPPEEVSVPRTAQSSQNGLTVGFHGTGGGLFKIMLINWILTFFTLGIYYFWGKTKVRRYLWEQSSFAGDRFHYHGTGGELFKGALVFGALLTLINVGIMTIGSIWGPQAEMIAQMGSSYLILFLLPVIIVGAFKYRLSRTAWRGIRFSFRGKRKSALWLYIKGYIFTFLTLGLYWPFFTIRKQEFWRSNAYFGSQSFSYKGEGKDILKAFLLLVLLYVVTMTTPLSLPLLVPGLPQDMIFTVFAVMWVPLIIGFLYYTVYLDRYHWSKTQFAGGSFIYDATGWQWFMLNFTNLLLTIITVGLALPLVIVRYRKFLADHLSVTGNMQLSKVVQQAQKSNALGEGVADGFDMAIDIGI